MTLFTYMTFVLVDDSHHLDASTSFVALSYFNVIRLALNVMPAMIKEGIKVSRNAFTSVDECYFCIKIFN